MKLISVSSVLFLTVIAFQSGCNPLVNNSHIDSGFTSSLATPSPAPQGAALALLRAVVSPAGQTVVVTLNPNGYGPLLPATGITGFSIKVAGTVATVTSATRTSDFEITLAMQNTIGSDQLVEVSYGAGNVTDSSALNDAMTAASSVSLINNASFDTDALAYFAQISTQGGSISTTTKQATQTLLSSLKSSGVWTKLIEVYPFAGDQLAAALVKLKVVSGAPAFLANSNFTSAQYSETGATGGLKGNGTTTKLDSGLPVLGLTRTSISMGAYVSVDSTTAQGVNCFIGSSYNATGDNDRFYLLGSGASGGENGQAGLGAYCPPNRVNGIGLRVMSFDGSNFDTYKVAVQTTQAAPALSWQQPGTVTLFRCAGNFPSDTRLAFAFVGTALTATEEAALNSAIVAFETTLTRNI